MYMPAAHNRFKMMLGRARRAGRQARCEETAAKSQSGAILFSSGMEQTRAMRVESLAARYVAKQRLHDLTTAIAESVFNSTETKVAIT